MKTLLQLSFIAAIALAFNGCGSNQVFFHAVDVLNIVVVSHYIASTR